MTEIPNGQGQEYPIPPDLYADFMELVGLSNRCVLEQYPNAVPINPGNIKILPPDRLHDLVSQSIMDDQDPLFKKMSQTATQREDRSIEYGVGGGTGTWINLNNGVFYVSSSNLEDLRKRRNEAAFAFGHILSSAQVSLSAVPRYLDPDDLDNYARGAIANFGKDQGLRGFDESEQEELLIHGKRSGLKIVVFGAKHYLEVGGKKFSQQYGSLADQLITERLIKPAKSTYARTLSKDLGLSPALQSGLSSALELMRGPLVPIELARQAEIEVLRYIDRLGINLGRMSLFDSFANSEIGEKIVRDINKRFPHH